MTDEFTFQSTYHISGKEYPCTVHAAISQGRALPYLADVHKDGSIVAVARRDDLRRFREQAQQELDSKKEAV